MKRFRLNQYLDATTVGYSALVLITLPFVWPLFSHSGLEFVIFLGLLVIFAALAYRMHRNQFEQRTIELTEVSRVHLATVEALATAIDARDQVGFGHVRRTQIYAVGIGGILGLDESDINALKMGALLHGIGKLAVPDHILNKPGSLTPAELEKTKINSMVGSSILENVGFDCPVIPTVKHHHESWDGSGYPDGLAKDKIPMTARILAVADAYDTLRGARPYRQALSREKARQIMQMEAGTRFDPAIVSVFLRNLASLEEKIQAEGLCFADSDVPGSANINTSYVNQIKLANREVLSLYELAREFSSSVNLNETFELFTKKIAEFVPFNSCALYLLDQTKDSATAVYVEGENKELLASRQINFGQGATGFALKSQKTVRNVDPDHDFTYSQTELAGQYSTMASVPLIAENELIGAVTIYVRDLAEYGDEHIRLLETISRIAADAIGKSLKHAEANTHAMTDPMTGLPNARSLQIQFDKEVARASRGDSSFQLLMLDLDGFKAVNDSFGHVVGDEMLKEIGNVILGQLRDYDFLARYGGDEFVALIPETSPGDVAELCGRIERAISEFSLKIDGKKRASVGVSLGASGYPKNGETFDQMIAAADKAMYDRKASRKRYALTHNAGQARKAHNNPQRVANDKRSADSDGSNIILELDETHIVSSSAVN